MTHLLFVDDDPLVLSSFRRTIHTRQPDWHAIYATCPFEALRILQSGNIDTVVTDMQMPRMSGHELLRKIKADPKTASIPVVIVTGNAERDIKRQSLDLGANDLLNKPVSVDDLIARVRNCLKIRDYEQQLRRHSESLEQQVAEKTAALSASRLDIIWRLAKASEYRDEETGNHVVRVGAYSRTIARSLTLDPVFVETLFHAAPLHDIGKLGIPDSILLKPGKLEPDQWRIMQTHCEIGVSILTDQCKLRRLATANESDGIDPSTQNLINPVLAMAGEIARCHHEKWDGSGYPNGLAGDNIPLSARIVAVCDVYDALRSRRPYKKAMSVDKATTLIRDQSGSHFDPVVVAAFFAIFDQIRSIEKSLQDVVEDEPETRSRLNGGSCIQLPAISSRTLATPSNN